MAHHIYHITVTTQARHTFFDDALAACAAARTFETRPALGDANLLAWVLMPDHAHWLLQLGERCPLHAVVRQLKSISACKVNRQLKRSGPVWARAYHDHALRDDENLLSVARYIVSNPLRAGLTDSLGNYPFWNAIWL